LNPDLSSILSVSADGKSARCVARAKAFSDKHSLPIYLDEQGDLVETLINKKKPPLDANKNTPLPPYILYYQNECLSILQTEKGAPGPVTASFIGGKTEHRRQFGGGKGQLIAKAVGLNQGVVPEVLDASAGLGRDAFVLASLGCKLTLLERSPVISELLSCALEEAQGSAIDDVVSRMQLISVNSTEWLNMQTDPVADVIYLDPMYPHREKSSLVKKEMRLFQALVGEDLDDAELLSAALQKARYRVVVKRPRKGLAIEGVAASYQLMGKSCRYDIYSIKSIAGLKEKSSSRFESRHS
jgi:16S rRNA (guanine1516-N2)-methyltransferase